MSGAVVNSGITPTKGAVVGALGTGLSAFVAGELTREQLRALENRGAGRGAFAWINNEQMAIWFGIFVMIVVEVGLIMLLADMNLFFINNMDRKLPMDSTYKAVLFFVASDLFRVLVSVAFPVIALVLIP